MLRKWTPRDKCFKRGALGPIGNRKTVEKIIQNRKTGKKFDKNRKPPAKLSKPIYFHIPIIKTLIDPIQWWQVEYKYTNFITVFVNAMDLAFVSSSTCLNYRLYFSCSLDSHYCFLSHCPLSYCCTVFVIHDAWTPTDGQSLRRHSRRVNPLRINPCVAVPSPPPPHQKKRRRGSLVSNSPWPGEGTATRGLPWDPCDISIGLSRIPLNNSYFQRLFEISGGA